MYSYKKLIEAPLSPLKPEKTSKNLFFDANLIVLLREDRLIDAYKKTDCPKKLKEILLNYKEFIASKAKAYQGYLNSRITLDDLISEANIGFIKALKAFDINQGYRISTLAKLYIKGQILDYIINNNFQTRIPSTLANKKLFFQSNKIKKFLRIKENITHEDDILNVSKCANSSYQNTKNFLNYTQQHHNSLDDIDTSDTEDHKKIAENEIFLHNKLDNTEDKLTLHNIQSYQSKILKRAFKELSKINVRQKDIIIARQYDDVSTVTLAKKYKLSNARINQIEKQARNNLKKILINNNINPINIFY